MRSWPRSSFVTGDPRRASSSPEAAPPRPGRIEQLLDRGAPLAFVAGIVFNIVPGVFPLIALKDIAELDYGIAETVVVLLGFYAIMFASSRSRSWAISSRPHGRRRRPNASTCGSTETPTGSLSVPLGIVGIVMVVRGIVGLVD